MHAEGQSEALKTKTTETRKILAEVTIFFTVSYEGYSGRIELQSWILGSLGQRSKKIALSGKPIPHPCGSTDKREDWPECPKRCHINEIAQDRALTRIWHVSCKRVRDKVY